MIETFTEQDWKFLVNRIRAGKCTPFLGAGLSWPIIPLGSTIASDWAKELEYPLEDSYSLTRVAEYLAVTQDATYAKTTLVDKWIRQVKPLDFAHPAEVENSYNILANLNLPLYITTNYDSFMYEALIFKNLKTVTRVPCPWNPQVRAYLVEREIDLDKVIPDASHPVVFHLHGEDDLPSSMVLTEDDYLDYVIELSRARRITHTSALSSEENSDPNVVLPYWIEGSLSGTTLLFIGYSFSDWNFNLLFRTINYYLRSSDKRKHISVQLAPGHDKKEWTVAQKNLAQNYLDKYFDRDKIDVFWGSAGDFLQMLSVEMGK